MSFTSRFQLNMNFYFILKMRHTYETQKQIDNVEHPLSQNETACNCYQRKLLHAQAISAIEGHKTTHCSR